MDLSLEGVPRPPAATKTAIELGLQSMGVAERVPVVLTSDYDGTVRRITGSTTYSGDRGTGFVGARTLPTKSGSVVIVNQEAIAALPLAQVTRLLAHEAGHALLMERGEVLSQRHQRLVTTEWEWHLMCLAAYSLDEVRVELAVWNAGHPESGSSSTEHLVEVLHHSTCDLLMLLRDPAAADPFILQQQMLALLDRLSKVLAYVCARVLVTGSDLRLAEHGFAAVEAWSDHARPSWSDRLALYRQAVPATSAVDEGMLETLFARGLDLEKALLRGLGFEFRNMTDGHGFYRRVGSATLDRWEARAIRQERIYDQLDG